VWRNIVSVIALPPCLWRLGRALASAQHSEIRGVIARAFGSPAMAVLQALVLAAAVLAGTSESHAGDVYRWTDSKGRVHLGDRPPPGVKAQAVGKLKSGAAAPTPPFADKRRKRQQRLLEAFEKQRKERKSQRENAAAQRDERTAKCAELGDEIERLKTARYLYRRKGAEREVLSDEERTHYIKRQEQLQTKRCR
jgi:hypothetical protein